MKRFFGILIVSFVFLLFSGGNTQSHAQQRLGEEIVLHLTSTLVSGNAVKIGYRIPYDGYIEFNLFDPAGERIWYTSYVREKGEYFLALRRDKLEASETYKFDFWYKGKKYSGSFNNT